MFQNFLFSDYVMFEFKTLNAEVKLKNISFFNCYFNNFSFISDNKDNLIETKITRNFKIFRLENIVFENSLLINS
jgi:hypothetical protein